jgi:hypothetical protein
MVQVRVSVFILTLATLSQVFAAPAVDINARALEDDTVSLVSRNYEIWGCATVHTQCKFKHCKCNSSGALECTGG